MNKTKTSEHPHNGQQVLLHHGLLWQQKGLESEIAIMTLHVMLLQLPKKMFLLACALEYVNVQDRSNHLKLWLLQKQRFVAEGAVLVAAKPSSQPV